MVRSLLYGVGFLLLAPPLAYGGWLVVTPDYYGGRRPFGAMVIAAVIAVVLLAYLARRELRREATPE